MVHRRSRYCFISDRRGVSVVLGFILMFGILILALTTYQAQIVPQENAATEFQHFEDVRDEMVVLRNSISTAGQQDISEFDDITLGTHYQTRVFTINPPSPSGTLQTSDAYNITIKNETTQTNVSTRFLEYNPGYFEIDVGSIWYEHSVLYLDERDRGNGISIIEDQNILKDGTVRIVALQNQYREDGTNRITLELYPQESLSNGSGTFPTGDLTVTIPTRLDSGAYWNEELGGKDGYQGVDIDARSEGVHALNLSVDSEDIEVNTVGTRSEPEEEPAKNVDPLSEGSSDASDSDGNDDSEGTSDELLEFQSFNKNDGGVVYFDVENTATEQLTVTDFSVNAKGLSNNPWLDNGNSPEVEIRPASGTNGEADDNKYKADGSTHNLDNNANIDSDSSAEIDMRILENNRGSTLSYTLEQTDSSSNADITVTLELDNNDAQVYYFEDTS